MSPAEALLSLSPAQLANLRACSKGSTPPVDLLALDDPRLVRGDGSRTRFANAIIAAADAMVEADR